MYKRQIYEWDHAHGDWTELAADAVLVDRCFRVPVPASALLDRVLADDTVARALIAANNRVIRALREKERELGRDEGLDEGLAPLAHQFARRLRRALTGAERELLRTRLGTLGAARLGDVVLDLAADETAMWLADPAAR